jgi:type II secretory pathway component PulJ
MVNDQVIVVMLQQDQQEQNNQEEQILEQCQIQVKVQIVKADLRQLKAWVQAKDLLEEMIGLILEELKNHEKNF